MKFKIILGIVFILITVFIINHFWFTRTPSIIEVEKIIRENLKLGDSKIIIEGYFKKSGISFGYDNYQRRYQCGYPGSERRNIIGAKSVIVIWVYLNDDDTFKNAVIERVYTFF